MKSSHRHFTLSLHPENADKVKEFMDAQEIVSPSQAVNALLAMVFAATPELGIQTADRARAYNETRIWAQNQVSQSFKAIAQLLDTMAGDAREMLAKR